MKGIVEDLIKEAITKSTALKNTATERKIVGKGLSGVDKETEVTEESSKDRSVDDISEVSENEKIADDIPASNADDQQM